MKKLFAFTILFACLASCATNEALQKNFQKGMSKFDFEAGFVMATLNDSPFQTCGYYKYFQDKSIEVFASKSKETFYIFHNVTDSQGKCPGGWILGSNGDGELLTTADTLSAALETVDQYGKRQASPQPSTVVSWNNNESPRLTIEEENNAHNELLISDTNLAKTDLADKEILTVETPETQTTGEDMLEMQMSEQNNSEATESETAIDHSLQLMCRGESDEYNNVTVSVLIGDKRNCGEYSNCQTEAFIVIPKVLFNSMRGIPKDECNGEAGNAICIKINDLEINDYVIRGTHLEKNTALILPVLESKGTVSIDRTTGKLVFQSGNNFGSSPTITADCVLQEKDAPKKF